MALAVTRRMPRGAYLLGRVLDVGVPTWLAALGPGLVPHVLRAWVSSIGGNGAPAVSKHRATLSQLRTTGTHVGLLGARADTNTHPSDLKKAFHPGCVRRILPKGWNSLMTWYLAVRGRAHGSERLCGAAGERPPPPF